MSSILKKVGVRIYSRHRVKDLFDAPYILGLRILVKRRRANAHRAGVAYAYAEGLLIGMTKITMRGECSNYSDKQKCRIGGMSMLSSW